MKRTTKKIPGAPGIYRVFVWSDKTRKWAEPKFGAKYAATRRVKGAEGKSKKEWKYCETFAEAKAFRCLLLVAPEQPQVVLSGSVEGGMRFLELSNAWRENSLCHKQPTTQNRYSSYLKHFVFFNEMPVERIGPAEVDQWIAHIKRPEYLKQHHSTRFNYEHEFSVLKGILGYYVERFNWNYRLPFLKGHKAMLKVREKPDIKKDLSVDQFREFLHGLRADVAGTKYEVIFYIAAMQYLIYGRVQEAAALHYEDFDFSAMKVHVRRKVQWMRKAGHEDRIVDGAKTNGGKVVDMSQNAAALFREWTMKAGIRSGSLFPFEGGIIPYRVVEYRYTKALRAMKLPFRATHILRHAALSEHYQAGKDLLSTAVVAGHGDTASTQRYAKARNEELTNIQRQVDQRLGSLVAE